MDIIIGDVHGCFEELEELLLKIGPTSSDRIISVGDMIDRGPYSPEVVSFFIKEKNAYSVLGNHERKHVLNAKGLMDKHNFGNTQRMAIKQFKDRGGENSIVTYEEALKFFVTLPLYMQIPGALVVHAGFSYGVPECNQNEKVLTGAGFKKENSRNDSGLFRWSDSYPEDADPIIFGHLGIGKAPWSLPQRKNLWPIDTGCCSGGYLTAVTLPDFNIYQIKSHQEEKKRLK